MKDRGYSTDAFFIPSFFAAGLIIAKFTGADPFPAGIGMAIGFLVSETFWRCALRPWLEQRHARRMKASFDELDGLRSTETPFTD